MDTVLCFFRVTDNVVKPSGNSNSLFYIGAIALILLFL